MVYFVTQGITLQMIMTFPFFVSQDIWEIIKDKIITL